MALTPAGVPEGFPGSTLDVERKLASGSATLGADTGIPPGVPAGARIYETEYGLNHRKRKRDEQSADAVGLATADSSNLLHRGVDAEVNGIPPPTKVIT